MESAGAATPDIRAGRDPRFPAGPQSFFGTLRRRLSGRENAADFVREVAAEHGDLTHYTFLGHHFYQINHPALLPDFFVRDSVHHHRNLVMQRSGDVLGKGLLTSEEPLHMRQRRLAQPAFLRQRIAAYGDVIGRYAVRESRRWEPGATVPMHPRMLELALRIVGKCLFDLDDLDDVQEMESAVASFMLIMPLTYMPFSRLVQRLPIPPMNRLRRGQRYLNTMIYGMIAERRKDPRDRGDLLSMLLSATDDSEGSGSKMDDRQLRDECVTVILAGHETTANALTFALDLLARNPDAQQRLHDEAVAALGDRSPEAADYPRLPYATQVFAEALRLYPPVWVTARTASEPYDLAGFRVPKGASLLAPQIVVHRDPRWWLEPERFDPERFTEAAKAARPRNSYFPFGGGSRQCIAEGLAWMEGTFCLAVFARDWRLSRVDGSVLEPELDPAITLRPKGPVPLRVERW